MLSLSHVQTRLKESVEVIRDGIACSLVQVSNRRASPGRHAASCYLDRGRYFDGSDKADTWIEVIGMTALIPLHVCMTHQHIGSASPRERLLSRVLPYVRSVRWQNPAVRQTAAFSSFARPQNQALRPSQHPTRRVPLFAFMKALISCCYS